MLKFTRHCSKAIMEPPAADLQWKKDTALQKPTDRNRVWHQSKENK